MMGMKMLSCIDWYYTYYSFFSLLLRILSKAYAESKDTNVTLTFIGIYSTCSKEKDFSLFPSSPSFVPKMHQIVKRGRRENKKERKKKKKKE
jgi:hypothetical protein